MPESFHVQPKETKRGIEKSQENLINKEWETKILIDLEKAETLISDDSELLTAMDNKILEDARKKGVAIEKLERVNQKITSFMLRVLEMSFSGKPGAPEMGGDYGALFQMNILINSAKSKGLPFNKERIISAINALEKDENPLLRSKTKNISDPLKELKANLSD